MTRRPVQVPQRRLEASARASGEIAASPLSHAFTSTLPSGIIFAPATKAPVSHVITRHPSHTTTTTSQLDTPIPDIHRVVAPAESTAAFSGHSVSARPAISSPRLYGIVPASEKEQRLRQVSSDSPHPTFESQRLQDPLVARFERLKLLLRDKSGSHLSSNESPLSPQKTTSPASKLSDPHEYQGQLLKYNDMAASSHMLPEPVSKPTQHGSGSFVPHSQPVPKLSARHTKPIVINDSDDDEVGGEQQPRPKKRRYENPPNPFQRSSRVKARATEPTRIKTPTLSRALYQESKRSNGLRSIFNGRPTSPNSSDVSYPDLTNILKDFEAPSGAREQHASGLGRTGPRAIPRMQTSGITGSRTPPISHTQPVVNSRMASSASTGTRANPIDLESESDLVAKEVLSRRSGSRRALLNSSRAEMLKDALPARRLQNDEERTQQAIVKTRECVVCGDQCPIHTLPSLAECTHAPQTCGTCYAGWVTAQLQQSGWREAKCPESKCQTRLEHHDIQHIASPDVFEQYDAFIARAALGEDPNFRWCRACSSGQIHMNGEEGNIFTCAACGHKVCIIHESTWHEGETCEEYEYRASGRQERDRKAQEEASLDAIGKLTKKCPGPNCVYNIEKNHGCDHMTCSRCRYEFCWVCLCDYNEIRRRGNSAHAENCQYHSRRLH